LTQSTSDVKEILQKLSESLDSNLLERVYKLRGNWECGASK